MMETNQISAPDKPEDTWIVIPCFNEDVTIENVVNSIANLGHSIVVVDDGSLTPVKERINKSNVHVCRHIINLGQGAAIQTGIKYALLHNAKFIVTFDADGQHRVEDIKQVVAPLLSGEYDVVLGSRFIKGGDALDIPKTKALILQLAILFTKLTTGLKVTDTHNGLRAFTNLAASKIQISQNGMAHATEILVEIKRNAFRYTETPVTILYTEYSLSKGQKISNAFNIVWDSMMGIFR
jgi:polyprenyl-phospho-N-acetylgalactosaminyl synthase